MRLKTEINDLTPEQWEQAQKILKTSYDLPENASRVCLTLVHGEEERHVEAPVSALVGLLISLTLTPAIHQLADAMTKIKAMAVLTPDDDRLPGEPCEHGAAVVKEEPSAFAGVKPTRTYSDGCQSYGPYQKEA